MTAVMSRRAATRMIREAEARIIPGAAVVQSIRATQPGLERLMRPEIQHAFEDLGERVAGASIQVGSPLREAQAVSPEEEARIDSIITASRIPTWKAQKLQPMFEKHWKRTAEATMNAIEKHDIRPSLRDRIAQDILLDGGKRMGLVDIEGDTRKALLKVVAAGKELGLSPRKTSLLIEHFVPKGRFTIAGKQYRSSMIARTETMSAGRESSIQAYKFSPTVERVVAFDGEEFDETCAARNGQIFSIEEAEAENGDCHPNCVLCWGPA